MAVGAGSMAMNAVKGVFGGSDKEVDKASQEVDKAAKKAGSKSADDAVSKALDSLRKSGKAPAICLPHLLPLSSVNSRQAGHVHVSRAC